MMPWYNGFPTLESNTRGSFKCLNHKDLTLLNT